MIYVVEVEERDLRLCTELKSTGVVNRTLLYLNQINWPIWSANLPLENELGAISDVGIFCLPAPCHVTDSEIYFHYWDVLS